MTTCKLGDSPISKSDKLHKEGMQWEKKKDMVKGLYARLVDRLVYAQVYTRPDIAY